MLVCWSTVHSIASITAVTYLSWREGASCAVMLVSYALHCQHNSCNLPVVEKEPAVLVCRSAVHSIASITAVTYLWWREGASCAVLLVSYALHCQHNSCNLPVVEKEPAVLLCWSVVHSIASITAVTYLWWRRSQLCCYAGQMCTPLPA